jgi:hypothetical protein
MPLIPAKRIVIIAALKATPNVSHVFHSVGKRMGVSYGSIWNIAAAEGIELVRYSRQWGKAFVARGTRLRVIAALKANPNALQVARKLHIKRDTVWRIAQQEGIELSQGRAAYQKKCAKIIEALKSNPNGGRSLGTSASIIMWSGGRRGARI